MRGVAIGVAGPQLSSTVSWSSTTCINESSSLLACSTSLARSSYGVVASATTPKRCICLERVIRNWWNNRSWDRRGLPAAELNR